ncbi:MAG: hypothetical protein ACLP0L_03110 [Solirubrobacteraceae bacterium]
MATRAERRHRVAACVLKTPMQYWPHAGVAALAESGSAALAPPTISAANTARAVLLIYVRNSFDRPCRTIRLMTHGARTVAPARRTKVGRFTVEY